MKKLCIISPAVGKYSTTFITNQINELPFEKYVISRENGELEELHGSRLFSRNLIVRIVRFIKRKIGKEDFFIAQNISLSKYLRKKKIDHVLFQFGTMAKLCYEACIYSNTEFTVHFHGYDVYKYEYDKVYYEGVFKHAKNIVVVSNHMRKRVIELGAQLNKIHVIPYGSNFTISNKQRGGNGEIRYLAVGRFVEKKAPYLTILAFAKALDENQNIRLHMAGDGELLSHCKHIVKALKIGDYVKFLGALSHEEIRNEMNKANFLIQHSITANNGDSEGLPNTIIEAIALKIPVISTMHTGIPEIVKHEKNGLLCEERDVESMAKNIIKAINMKFEMEEPKELLLENSIDQLSKILNS